MKKRMESMGLLLVEYCWRAGVANAMEHVHGAQWLKGGQYGLSEMDVRRGDRISGPGLQGCGAGGGTTETHHRNSEKVPPFAGEQQDLQTARF